MSVAEGFRIIWKSIEKQWGPESLSIMSQVSAVEGCPLSGVPLFL